MPAPLRIVLILVLLAGCADRAPQPSKNDIITHTLATTVQVVTERADGVRRSGSGVLVERQPAHDRTIVLTTHHLLAPLDDQDIRVRFPSGDRELEATLLAVDAEIDLAILATPSLEPHAARLQGHAYLGDPVWVVAFPWGRRRTVVNGVVSQIEWPGAEPPATAPITGPVRLIDASVSYGMSGGGVFDADIGTLVGLVRGYRTAQLSLPGLDTTPVRLPVAGETTVISSAAIACFLEDSGVAAGQGAC